ncbi:MAG: hypothetical protein AAF551_15095 [Bacteroidota bacterium]
MKTDHIQNINQHIKRFSIDLSNLESRFLHGSCIVDTDKSVLDLDFKGPCQRVGDYFYDFIFFSEMTHAGNCFCFTGTVRLTEGQWFLSLKSNFIDQAFYFSEPKNHLLQCKEIPDSEILSFA